MDHHRFRGHWHHKLVAAVACLSLAGAVGCSTTPAVDDDQPDEQVEQMELQQEQHDDHDHAHDHDHDHAHDHDHDHDHAHDHDHGDADHHDHSFDDPEKYAERWNDPARDEWQQPEALIEAMGVEEGMTVADIGAGTGYMIPFLAEAVGDEGTVIAVDVEESMLQFIEEMADEKGLDNVETVLPEDGTSGLDEASVDRIITINTWHHIPNREDYSAHLTERLADGGMVWVVDFHEDSPIGPPEHHRLAEERVHSELEAGGFDTRGCMLELERQYIVVGTVE